MLCLRCCLRVTCLVCVCSVQSFYKRRARRLRRAIESSTMRRVGATGGMSVRRCRYCCVRSRRRSFSRKAQSTSEGRTQIKVPKTIQLTGIATGKLCTDNASLIVDDVGRVAAWQTCSCKIVLTTNNPLTTNRVQRDRPALCRLPAR